MKPVVVYIKDNYRIIRFDSDDSISSRCSNSNHILHVQIHRRFLFIKYWSTIKTRKCTKKFIALRTRDLIKWLDNYISKNG